MKRAMALICAFVFSWALFCTTFPTVSATETEAKRTSIFVATDRHEAGTGNNLVAILEQITADTDAILPSVALLGGDQVGEGPDAAPNGQPVFSLEDVNGEITSVLGGDVTTYYTFGSHDNNAMNGYEAFFTGPKACDGYYLYGISYAQMLYATDEQAEAADYGYLDIADSNGISAQTASANFLSWAASLEDNMPIIFMSHVPMHVNRKDNLGAAIWCDALNKAAETHDVIVLFGHNHTLEGLSSIDRLYYLVPAGSSMPVQGADKEGDYSEPVTIGFSYMNAGYLTLGFGTLMTFSDLDLNGTYDELTIARYSTTGKDEYFGDTEIESPCIISLTQWGEQNDSMEGVAFSEPTAAEGSTGHRDAEESAASAVPATDISKTDENAGFLVWAGVMVVAVIAVLLFLKGRRNQKQT